MEATRYSSDAGTRPASLLLSGAVVALAVAGIIAAAPRVGEQLGIDPPIIGYPVPIPPAPPPPPSDPPPPPPPPTIRTSTRVTWAGTVQLV